MPSEGRKRWCEIIKNDCFRKEPHRYSTLSRKDYTTKRFCLDYAVCHMKMFMNLEQIVVMTVVAPALNIG